ncbi:MAG: hypothetical protein PHX68_01935 [Alphaproteobacteria bacterium]|nr:hypothetical protein [Alphaproteobacteria bacterium]
MQYTDTLFKQQLDLARAYAAQWHAGMSVPIGVSAATYLTNISDTILEYGGDRDAAIAACLYKGVVPSASYACLINQQTQDAGDGSNTMDSIRYLFGNPVAGIVADLNQRPLVDPSQPDVWKQIGEWANYCLGRPAQFVLLAEKFRNFQNRLRPGIPSIRRAKGHICYCTSRFKVIDAIAYVCPRLAKEGKNVGYRLLDESNAYLRAKVIGQRGRE